VWVGEPGCAFGLRSAGLLLCAEADGRVTLSRRELGPWERFELVNAQHQRAPESNAPTV
jgi:hypothetical protein